MQGRSCATLCAKRECSYTAELDKATICFPGYGVPPIPLFLTGLIGATPAVIGLIEGTAESLASLLRVVADRYCDRLARRKP